MLLEARKESTEELHLTWTFHGVLDVYGRWYYAVVRARGGLHGSGPHSRHGDRPNHLRLFLQYEADLAVGHHGCNVHHGVATDNLLLDLPVEDPLHHHLLLRDHLDLDLHHMGHEDDYEEARPG